MDKQSEDKSPRESVSSPRIPINNSSPKNKSGENHFFPPLPEDKNAGRSPRQVKPLELRRMSSVNNLVRRRSSVAQTPQSPTTPKPSFRAIGGKVTSMLRAKMAFQRKGSSADDTDVSAMAVIKELPATPRFSSSLSPEAQFAMMKGYEDAVYGYLCKSYPEYKTVLKRTRTPVNSIDIKDVPRSEKQKPDTNRLSSSGPFFDKPAENRGQFSQDNSVSPVSRSTSLSTIPTGQSSKLSRTQSHPVLVPLHRQLVLTHRLQSAMDILDTVRGNMGMHAISPRIQTKTKDTNPVQDYNSWTRVWNTEFQIAKTKG